MSWKVEVMEKEVYENFSVQFARYIHASDEGLPPAWEIVEFESKVLVRVYTPQGKLLEDSAFLLVNRLQRAKARVKELSELLGLEAIPAPTLGPWTANILRTTWKRHPEGGWEGPPAVAYVEGGSADASIADSEATIRICLTDPEAVPDTLLARAQGAIDAALGALGYVLIDNEDDGGKGEERSKL